MQEKLYPLALGSEMVGVRLVVNPRRRNFGLRVLPDLTLELAIPIGITHAEALSFLQEHIPWIQGKLAAMAARPKPPVRLYASGDEFLYLGSSLRLRVLPQNIRRVQISLGEGLLAIVPQGTDGPKLAEAVRAALEAWYRKEAQTHLAAQAALYAPLLGVHPKRLVLKDTKTRWGSCSAHGTVNLNWRLIMAPHAVFRYVVIHELAHLQIMNHSPRFWRLVASVAPDWQATRKWLAENGHLLIL